MVSLESIIKYLESEHFTIKKIINGNEILVGVERTEKTSPWMWIDLIAPGMRKIKGYIKEYGCICSDFFGVVFVYKKRK